MEVSVESTCHHVTWKVHDFFPLPSEIGYSLDSPEIRFADDSYCLQLCPNELDMSGKTIIEVSLVRLTYTFPERNVSCKIGRRRINERGVECDLYYGSSTLDKCVYLLQSILEEKGDKNFPGGTFTILCSMRLKEQSSGGSPQSVKAKTSDEDQKGLPGQSVSFSSHWRSSKMELSIESPCQYVTWKVQDFFQLLSNSSYCLISPVFRFADDRYCLRFYPKGDMNGDTADFELQLVRLTSTFPEGTVLYKVGYRGKSIAGKDLDTYHYSGTLIHEFAFCLSRSQLETARDDYVRDGTLTVLCSMRLREQSSSGSRQSEEVGPSDAEEKQDGLPGVPKLLSDYRQLLQKGAQSDACLVVSGKEFRAHRCVLRSRSAVFEAMFGHETTERDSGRVIIDDLDPESFEEFLEYLYTGGVEAGLSDDNAFWLYAAAEKYDVSTLKSECVAHMRRTLSVDSFCDVLTLALRHREEDLMQHAIQFFKENLQRILLTAKWQQFVIDNGTSANELFIKAVAPRGQ